MTRINTSDQVLLLLREQLRRLDRTRGGRAGQTSGTGKATPRPMARLQALAAMDGVSEKEFGRTLVRALLSERMGEGVANDPAFQAMVDDVFRIISDSDEGRGLMERATRRLRAEA